MDFEGLIAQGWKDHARNPAEVARSISEAQPATPEQAAALLRLGNHVLGEHLNDWEGALGLAERVAAGFADDFAEDGTEIPGIAEMLQFLIVAQTLDGDRMAALSNQHRLHALSPSQASLRQLKLSGQLPGPLVRAGRFEEGAAIYRGLLLPARQQNDSGVQRHIAIVSNNLATALLELPTRTPQQAALMQEAAQVALEFWLRCGTWVNHERALYLQALVANAVNQAQQALQYADQALALIAAHGAEPVDQAFILLARAHALRVLGNPEGYGHALADAQTLADAFDDVDLKTWYAEEKARAVGAPLAV
ncbi:hypothetical protein JCM19000A_08230 [Silvimonas sp. JCM 19000]